MCGDSFLSGKDIELQAGRKARIISTLRHEPEACECLTSWQVQ